MQKQFDVLSDEVSAILDDSVDIVSRFLSNKSDANRQLLEDRATALQALFDDALSDVNVRVRAATLDRYEPSNYQAREAWARLSLIAGLYDLIREAQADKLDKMKNLDDAINEWLKVRMYG